LQQVRRLALALRPSMLDDLGLLPALRWMAEQVGARSGFAVRIAPEDTDTPERLPPELESACYRIAQEALTNIARHAQATQVDIALQLDTGTVTLVVRDDGCGFDTAAMQARALGGNSLGVLGMQERATLLGGCLTIESQPGHGCTVRLTV
jgi:signal transduction histidine kinase